jgi:hypothetical protein
MITLLERNKLGMFSIDKMETKNGSVELPLFDDRFILNDFAYVVDIGFKDLPEATNSEDYVLRRYSDILQQVKQDNPELSQEEIERSVSNDFYSNLANLISTNDNTLAGSKVKSEALEEEVRIKDEIILEKDEQILSQILNIERQQEELDRKDMEIEQLRSSIQSMASATTQSLQRIEDLSMKQTEQLVSTINALKNTDNSGG